MSKANPAVKTRAKKVKQIDPKTKKVIKIHDTITDAAKAVDVSRQAIQNVIRGTKLKAKGYYWKEVNPDDDYDILTEDDLAIAKVVEEYEDYYCFPDGRAYGLKQKHFLTPCVKPDGRLYFSLSKNGLKKTYYISLLVADHFLPNKPHKNARARHINSDQTNNHVENLEWIVPKRKGKIDKLNSDDSDEDKQIKIVSKTKNTHTSVKAIDKVKVKKNK